MTPASKTIRLLIVDDHPVVRQGLVAMLSYQEDIEVVAEAGTGKEAVESFERHGPDMTLMDLARNPNARVIVLTTFGGDMRSLRALKAGALGYLLKDGGRKDLLDTIRGVHQGSRRMPREIALDLAEHCSDQALTFREIEVLREVAAGNSNKMVAQRLCVSEDTVKSHMRNIVSKLSANDRTHAVTIALRRGFLDL